VARLHHIKYLNMEALISCCDVHDFCYENCTHSRTNCDNNFHRFWYGTEKQ